MWTLDNLNQETAELRIFDESGGPVATIHCDRTNPDFAEKRATLFVTAPETFKALADLVTVCKKEFPDHMLKELKSAEEVLARVSP